MCRRAAVMDEGRGVFTLRICRALRGGRVPGESLTRVLVGPAGSYEPTGRVQPAIVSDNHRDTVWKQHRAPWFQSWRVETSAEQIGEGSRGPPAGGRRNEHERVCARACRARACPARACLRTLGRVAVGLWPYGLWNLAVWPLDSRRMAFPHFAR